MAPSHVASSSQTATRDDIHPDLHVPLRGISEQTQLLQRRILRADGLTTLDRDLMLGTLAAIRGDLDTLTRRLSGASLTNPR